MSPVFAVAPGTSGGGGGSDSPVIGLIVALLIFAMSATLFLKPDLQWKLNRSMYKRPDALEPSARGLLVTRLSSGVVAIVALVFLVIALTRL